MEEEELFDDVDEIPDGILEEEEDIPLEGPQSLIHDDPDKEDLDFDHLEGA
jgi:hypothetical protein